MSRWSLRCMSVALPLWLALYSSVDAEERNFCSKIETKTTYEGTAITFENGTNFWSPATLSQCCAACHGAVHDPGMPRSCKCWTWGHDDSVPGCEKSSFSSTAARFAHVGNQQEEKGCCWLKNGENLGLACDARVSRAEHLISGFTSMEVHNGGLPSDGWSLAESIAIGISGGFMMYFGGGILYGSIVGRSAVLPHSEFWCSVRGLVIDGIRFVVSRRQQQGSIQEAMVAQRGTNRASMPKSHKHRDREGESTGANLAVRGEMTTLHAAASTGDVARLRSSLGTVDGMENSHLNCGDHRRYTPFHIACAGGHASCVRLLLKAGCDTTLREDSGLTGWELAEQLHRKQVIQLQEIVTPQGSQNVKSIAGSN